MEKGSRQAVSFSLFLANYLQFVAIYFISIMNKNICKIAIPHNP